METETEMIVKPTWLEGLMRETFFGVCGIHEKHKKNEKNIFCLLCCLTICPHCLPSHCSHPLLQVRRYVYHDVVRLGDLEKLIECSYIQPYTINGAKVIFLKERAQSRSCKGSANICLTCDRILQDPFHFCSLSCKVDYLVDQGEDLSSIIHRNGMDESEDIAFSQFQDLRMDGPNDQITSNSILEDPVQMQHKGSSCSNSGDTKIVRNKKKGSGFLGGIVLSLTNKRKGAPQRAPLS